MPGLQRRYWFGAMASLGVIVALSLASPSSSGGAVSPARVRAAVAWAPMEGEIIVAGTFVGVLTVAVTVIQLVVMTVRPATPGDERAIRHETQTHGVRVRAPASWRDADGSAPEEPCWAARVVPQRPDGDGRAG